MVLPLSTLRSYGGRLVAFIDTEVASYRLAHKLGSPWTAVNAPFGTTSGQRTSTTSSCSDYSDDRQTLMEEPKPEMTDGESVGDSEADDEYA